MKVIFLMAGITGGRCTFVDPVNVATVACDAGVCPGQHKCRQIMVKGGRDPASCGVTSATIRAELAAVRVSFLMAGRTGCRCVFVDLVDMATLTGHVGMLAIQFENEQAVVYIGREPAPRVMAGATINWKLAVVLVIFLVAGITVLRCSIVHMIYMTFLADHIYVFAGKFEGGQIVVEFCRDPAIGSVAISTVRS